MKFLLVLTTLFFSSAAWPIELDCLEWLTSIQAISAKECKIQCLVKKVDMATFTCHDSCEEFCQRKFEPDGFLVLFGLYGLTPEEIKLLISNPLQMRYAYSASKTAVQTCENIFIFNENNDESDACRNFVWSALLIDKMKATDAKQILDAHEAEATQPPDELKMDQKNNDLGLKVGEKLKNDGALTPDAAIEEFQKAFKKIKSSTF